MLSSGVLEVVVTRCRVFREAEGVSSLAKLRRYVTCAVLALALAGIWSAAPASAQDAGQQDAGQNGAQDANQSKTASAAAAASLEIELNKLEPQGKSCRAYLVIKNKSAVAYSTFKVDLIQFRTDGIIGHRFLFDLGPIRADKEAVKLFDLDTPCDQIGSFLVNDVTECKTDAGPSDDCMGALKLSSRAKAQLTK